MTAPGALHAGVSRSALLANARLAREAGDGVADVRRDAFGHGVAAVSAALAAAGVREVRADESARAAVAAAGLTVTQAAPTLDSRTLYGLPGGAGMPAMRIAGSVLSVKPLLAGEGVSYGHTHIADRDTRIALVSGGYGQGVVRSLGNRVSVEIRGALHPIVGRVAMDVCVIDVGASAAAAPGDEVVYFGGDGAARDLLDAWESVTGLTAAEIVCTLGLRVPREDAA